MKNKSWRGLAGLAWIACETAAPGERRHAAGGERLSPHAPAAGAQVHYSTTLFLHGRASHLVAAIYDPLTGKVAAGRTDLTIP